MFVRLAPTTLALVLLSAVPAGAVEVHAHRGGTGAAPENSLAAFRHALDLGVDALELDLQLTRDSVLVVHHDAEIDLGRCAGPATVKPPSRRIRDLSSAQLAELRCEGEPVPRFTEVLALVSESGSTAGLTVELKLNGGAEDALRPQLAWRVLADLEGSGLEAQTLIQSFDVGLLALVKAMQPAQRTGVLVRSRGDYAESLAESGADALLPRADGLRAEDVETCRSLGVRVIPWTVNDLDELDRLVAWGVDGVITDRPDLVLDHLARGRRPAAAARSATSTTPAPEVVGDSEEPPFELADVRLAAVVPFTSRGRFDTFCTTLFEENARGRFRNGFPEVVDMYALPVQVVDGKPFQPRAVLPQLLAAARELGAQAVVVGEGNWYGPFNNRWRMEIRLIEANQGRVLWSSVSKSGPAISGPQAKREVVREILRDFRRARRGGA